MTTKLKIKHEETDIASNGQQSNASEQSSKVDSVTAKASHESWKRLQKRLTKPSAVNQVNRLLGNGEKSPLSWLIPGVLRDTEGFAQIQAWHAATLTGKKAKSSTRAICDSVNQINASALNYESAFTALGAANAIRMCAGQLDESTWQQLFDDLICIIESVNLELSQDLWLFQLCSVELPLVFAFQAQDIVKPKKIGKAAIKKMESIIADTLDGDGWAKFEVLPIFGPLVASWTRTNAIAKDLGLKISTAPAYQLEWAVRQIIRLARPDGTLMGSMHESNPVTAPCVATMLKMSADPFDRKIAKACFPFGSKPAKQREKLVEESSLSAWAEVGVFQREWKRKTPKCAFAFGDSKFWLEICRHTSLIEGDCTPQVSLNGSPLTPEDEFIIVCENQSTEIDYLELEVGFGHGVTLQRQLVFGRKDQFLIASDVIRSERPARLDYRCEFPLGPGIDGMAERETREFYLKDKKIRSLVLPLALPEWKIARTDDCLVHKDHRLILSQAIDGNGLFAGLFFDLNPRRSLEPRTWRPLTIAENLKVVDRDVAVAFRIQIGSEQWVLYRSVGPAGNRSFLGENINDDFFVGRFKPKGTGSVSELLQIE